MSSDNSLEVARLDLESRVGPLEYYNSTQSHDQQQQDQVNSFGHQSNFNLGNITLNLNTGQYGDIHWQVPLSSMFSADSLQNLISNCSMGTIRLINMAVSLTYVFLHNPKENDNHITNFNQFMSMAPSTLCSSVHNKSRICDYLSQYVHPGIKFLVKTVA